MHALDRLGDHIAQVPERLAKRTETELTEHAAGKWSRKEILGHLIDSALNNLKRFTDAQLRDGPYSIQGYNQDGLVAVNQYHHLPLEHLLGLWSLLNTQILYVAKTIPTEALTRTVHFGPVSDPDQTLAWLIEDYVAHLEHHLKTLL